MKISPGTQSGAFFVELSDKDVGHLKSVFSKEFGTPEAIRMGLASASMNIAASISIAAGIILETDTDLPCVATKDLFHLYDEIYARMKKDVFMF